MFRVDPDPYRVPVPDGAPGSVPHQNGFGNGFAAGHTVLSVSASKSSPFFIT